MQLDAYQLAPFASPTVPCREQSGELVRAEVAVLVRHIPNPERLSGRLVGILPVNEDGDSERCSSLHKTNAPPVRPIWTGRRGAMPPA